MIAARRVATQARTHVAELCFRSRRLGGAAVMLLLNSGPTTEDPALFLGELFHFSDFALFTCEKEDSNTCLTGFSGLTTVTL